MPLGPPVTTLPVVSDNPPETPVVPPSAVRMLNTPLDVALPSKGVVYGEISLSGDVRPVGRSDARLKEAAKLGFTEAIAPQAAADDAAPIRVRGVATALELVQTLNAMAGN